MGRSPVQSRPEAPGLKEKDRYDLGVRSISVGTFTKSILIEVARIQGLLSEAEIEVRELPVRSSPAQFEALESGQIDLAFTNPDNVLAYRYLTSNPLHRSLDVRIIAAVDRGLGVSLCYAPELTHPPLTFGVDVPNSGFAFVGYELLAMSGVAYGSYQIVSLGSTPKRRVELTGHRVEATILNAGNELKAISQGALQVADVALVGRYIGTVLATLGKPTSTVIDFQAIINKVISEILAGQHKELIVAAARKNLELDEEFAALHYAAMLSSDHGLVSDGVVDQDSINTIIALRRKYLPSPDLDGIIRDWSALVSTI